MIQYLGRSHLILYWKVDVLKVFVRLWKTFAAQLNFFQITLFSKMVTFYLII